MYQTGVVFCGRVSKHNAKRRKRLHTTEKLNLVYTRNGMIFGTLLSEHACAQSEVNLVERLPLRAENNI